MLRLRFPQVRLNARSVRGARLIAGVTGGQMPGRQWALIVFAKTEAHPHLVPRNARERERYADVVRVVRGGSYREGRLLDEDPVVPHAIQVLHVREDPPARRNLPAVPE